MILPEKDTIGIYKITSPSGRIYIGQSRCIRKRWISYKSIECIKGQPKLYRSFKKYGLQKHKFEVIEECEFEDLNRLERHYQEIYNSVEKGLNCVYQESEEKPRILSEETKRRISEGNKGKIVSSETRRKISEGNKRKKLSEETRRKMSEGNKGRVLSEETKHKISEARKGSGHTQETRLKISESKKGKQIKAISPKKSVLILGINDLSKELNTSGKTIRKILKGGHSKKWQEWTFEYVDKDSD